MIRPTLSAAALLLCAPAFAQEAESSRAPSPNEIVAQAAPEEWRAIAPDDLLVMNLAPDRRGESREVVIQLMPPPFSQGWVENIRILARAGWYDGISVNRVQDNYVVQWGDANHDNPAAEGEAKPLPEGLNVMDESEYVTKELLSIPDSRGRPRINYSLGAMMMRNALIIADREIEMRQKLLDATKDGDLAKISPPELPGLGDRYAPLASVVNGWPIAGDIDDEDGPSDGSWPVHCYGMVGVGRSYSPDTGSGAELYMVIGHAPRHLDRNIALVGRVIEGIEHLSSLPRGTGPLGFYETAQERVPIRSVVMASDMRDPPRFEYLSTESETFARYAEARANRRDPFFIVPAGGADICNIPVPVRRQVEDTAKP